MTKNKFSQLSEYYSQLQSRLQHYATLKTQLDTRGEEMRKEISRRMAEKSELLRAREKQLLRQVDVASAHFMSLYLVHHAHLHQLVGTARNFLDKNKDEAAAVGSGVEVDKEVDNLVDRIRSGLKDCDLGTDADDEPTGAAGIPISVVFPVKTGEDLDETIADFGEVCWGQGFCLPSFHSGDGEKNGFGFLPYWHEDYQDSEIEVLQSKPLLGTPSLVRFPRTMQTLPQKVGFPVEEKNRWLLQHLQKGTEPLVKQQNIEASSRMAKEERELKKSESSCSGSIEILGNTDDECCCDEGGFCGSLCDQAHWSEDDEFMLLKTFCKKDPVCQQLKECCGEKIGKAHCLKKALEKPSSSVPVVNINNRSVSRNANWLLNKRNVEGVVEVDEAEFKQVPWKVDDAGSAEWKKTVAKSWERIWKADNETWLIRKKRMEIAAAPSAENIWALVPKEEIAPVLLAKPAFDRTAAMDNSKWTLPAETTRVDTPDKTMFMEAQSRLFSGKDWTLPTGAKMEKPPFVPTTESFFAKLRETKAANCDWVVSRKTNHQQQEQQQLKQSKVGSPAKNVPINYKLWLAPACNSSPHSEKFMSLPVRSSPIMMEKNLFTTGVTVKSGVWLLRDDHKSGE